MSSEPALTVAILSYDGLQLLQAMLPSLDAQRFRGFRTVVVDNGSSDGTAAWLAEHRPDIDVVALPSNVGVTAALNACIDAAAGSEFVGLFNNDLELDRDCLGELVAALRVHPGAASAGAKLVDFHDRDVLDGAGDLFGWGCRPMRRGHGERDLGQYDEARAIFGACGAAAVYRRSALDAIGRFDDSFFAFYEDADWAFRAQLAGWDCRYAPSAVAYHMGSATLGAGLTDFTRYHLLRNAIWLVAKDYPVSALLREAPRLAHAQTQNLSDAVRAGKFGVWRRAIGHALRGLPAALRRRRAVQRLRVRSLRELDVAVGGDR